MKMPTRNRDKMEAAPQLEKSRRWGQVKSLQPAREVIHSGKLTE